MPKRYQGDEDTFSTYIPVPADGEAMSERVCAPAWKASANRTAYVKKRLPIAYSYANDGVNPDPIWTYANGGSLELVTATLSTFKLDVPSCAVGDKIRVESSFVFNVTDVSAFVVYIDAIGQYGGAVPTQAHVTGAKYNAASGISDAATRAVTLSGLYTVTLEGTTRFALAVTAPSFAGMDEFNIWTATITAIRFPQ